MKRSLYRRVVSRARHPFRSPAPPEPLKDWNLNPYLHPSEALRGYAGHFVDMNGRDYVDMHSAWGANILGYGYPRVADAIAEQAREFAGVGLPYPRFRELAALLTKIIPCAEEVRFGKNGSDATLGAVRAARALTGRDIVLHRGYHGFHDWWMASLACPGVPASLRDLIVTLDRLAPDAVAECFGRMPDRIASLILDPILPPVPSRDEIVEIRRIVHRRGAILIFDEVVSGFRVAPGGMQEVWGVAPDFACYGKGVANGMPLSVLAGPTRYMARLPETHYGMTFEGEAVSIAAATATISEIVEKDVCGALGEMGRRLKEEYERLAREYRVRSELAGPDARPYLYFEDQNGIPERELRWLFVQEMVGEGILMLGTLNPCFSHTESDLGRVRDGFAKGMKAVREVLDAGTVEGRLDPRVLASMRV